MTRGGPRAILPPSMRRLVPALAAAALLSAAGCSESPCQDLGERLCACSGQSGDACTTQVEEQLKDLDQPQSTLDRCAALLDSCHEPAGARFCEWLGTEDGKRACGLAEPELAGTTSG